MGEYNLMDAMNDSERPLTVPPDEWVMKMKQRRGSAKSGESKVAVDESKKDQSDEEKIARVDSAVDGIISGIREFYDALALLKRTKLTPKERSVFTKVTDLLDTAVSPYVSDIVKELDKLEEE
jgi:hypothetical protein